MKTVTINDIEMLQSELLASHCNISHFTTTRGKGVDEANPYSHFNLADHTGDNPTRVARNRAQLCEALAIAPQQLIIPHQTHSTTIAIVEKKCTEKLDGVDALITQQKGICLAIATADCVPILLYDPIQQVVAAIHAGWRGTVAHLPIKTVREMESVFGTQPKDIVAYIGASISQAHYEVGDEVVAHFENEGFDLSRIVATHPLSGKSHIDLWESNRQELLKAGIPDKQIEVAGDCTYSYPLQLFSARRLGIASGRILSGIMLGE